MIQIVNKEQLVKNGVTSTLQRARQIALKSLECAINAANPKELVLAKLTLHDTFLQVENFNVDLAKIKRIFVVGGGKAGAAMVRAVEDVLGERVNAGVVNVPVGGRHVTCVVELNEASHPLPNQAGVDGVHRMMELVKQAEADDLVVCLLSGGGSSLMPLPRNGISLRDNQALTASLIKSGASIAEINVVRKHLSRFKGGWLAREAYPATVLSLILSDVVGDQLDAIASGPTVPDPSTFDDAIKILEKYELWGVTPPSVRRVLTDGSDGLIDETPKPGDAAFSKVFNFVVGNNKTATQAAAECLKSEGLKTVHFDEPLEGEARQIGAALAKFSSKVSTSGFSLPRPLAVVAGGETTVTVTGEGLGGRNQELALSAVLNFDDVETCVVASLSTDGVDGPTDAAGAIVDAYSLNRASQLGLNAQQYLKANDSNSFFKRLGDAIITGPTGTNVNDISVIVVL